jgi:PKHD-type hydroxylase
MLQLPNVLTGDDLASIRAELDGADLIDGKVTGRHGSGRVKNNREVAGDHPAAKRIGDLVLARLGANRAFREFALPHRIRMPILSVYEPGMAYGNHVDAPVMGDGPVHTTRTDLSTTVFLNEAASYDGGELVLVTPAGEQSVKLEAGSAVIYPTSYIHRVAPVTRGIRLAVVTWMQSRVQDHHDRQVLFDLATAIRALPADMDEAERLKLHHVFTRLYQKWAVV